MISLLARGEIGDKEQKRKLPGAIERISAEDSGGDHRAYYEGEKAKVMDKIQEQEKKQREAEEKKKKEEEKQKAKEEEEANKDGDDKEEKDEGDEDEKKK